MKGSLKLFRLFGIDIKLHFSWWFVFILLAWSLSSHFFPHFYPALSTPTHWFMGIIASLFLFLSVLLHELSHSLVAKAKNIKVESITLFFFGGVASITDEEMKPTDELQMALAGPFFSLFLAALFFIIFKYNGNLVLTGIMFYLYQLNLILALFNLVPGYPLDGGRAFRAVLYAYYHDLKKATQIAAKGGKFFAGFLIFLGIFSLLTNTANGLWFIFLGGFLYFIAGMSYEQVVIKETLSKLPVQGLLEKKFLKVDPELTFAQLLHQYYKYNEDTFLVQKGQEFLGILDLKRITKMSPETQARMKVRQILLPSSQIKSVDLKNNCYQAFRSLLEQDLELLPVTSQNSIKGVISKRALVHRLILELKYSLSLNYPLLKEKIKRKKK